jgi:hypothetical protein
MKAANRIVELVKESYICSIILVLGVFAFASAILIAYPALAYLASTLLV